MSAVSEAMSRKPFQVTPELLAMNWGNHKDGLACGICDVVPIPGDTIVLVMGSGCVNTFCCWDCVGFLTAAEATAEWSRHWREFIAPILKRWADHTGSEMP